MGRTLQYAIYDDPKNYREAEREIRIAQELLIHRFTWACEQPSLWILDEDERLQWETDHEGRPTLRGLTIDAARTRGCNGPGARRMEGA